METAASGAQPRSPAALSSANGATSETGLAPTPIDGSSSSPSAAAVAVSTATNSEGTSPPGKKVSGEAPDAALPVLAPYVPGTVVGHGDGVSLTSSVGTANDSRARRSASSAKKDAQGSKSSHGVLENVVDALEHINSPTWVQPPGAVVPAGGSPVSVDSDEARTPVVGRAKSKRLHFASSHQAYTGIDPWLDNYEIDLEDLGPNFRSGKLTNAQRLDLATYAWTQNNFTDVKGAVVLFHSYTSHALWDFMRHQPAAREVVAQVDTQTGETEAVDMQSWVPIYNGSWVEAFWNQGFNVYAMDHQSHGRSAGWREWRCNVEKFDHLVDDALLFIKTVVATDQMTPDNAPIYVLGYSMGGNITLQTLARIFLDHSEEGKKLQSRVKAAVLLAPMLRILFDKKTEFLAKINKSVISCCMPNLRLGRSSGDEAYAYLDRWYEKDPYAYSGSAKSRMIANLYSATLKTKKLIKNLPAHLRILCLQGTADSTVDHRAALLLAKTPVRLDLMYLTGWSHYLAKQIGFELLRDLVAAWVHAKLQLDKAQPTRNDSFEQWSAQSCSRPGRVAVGTQTSFAALTPPVQATVSAKSAAATDAPVPEASAAAQTPEAATSKL
ncbi:hypothetical protein NCLIV_001135 [Neospora caninum Liverpool]|uniref:Serine aminopeptidase S33 domain-containing protein n=1 Tax=Neospora caninum (strain Liverpool) TaxID=572307 RepID=F0V7D0_NEOCL|nr:hypothetical protein NCLIV_001135 [Neospora caninum Liverpool]CBZ49621.1 hypothetical protein NCLIV_001135 [Neospora caninum Liverpool]CEL64202.1 TPA: hypothetical protein BN1204_001135 [Neospora caninum Liverpool]|eukprot:XP_003879656.1 hypothetical protein NCLIV_001135 [Neospora caninum Liverpool]